VGPCVPHKCNQPWTRIGIHFCAVADGLARPLLQLLPVLPNYHQDVVDRVPQLLLLLLPVVQWWFQIPYYEPNVLYSWQLGLCEISIFK
jgi:hypothetical protein